MSVVKARLDKFRNEMQSHIKDLMYKLNERNSIKISSSSICQPQGVCLCSTALILGILISF